MVKYLVEGKFELTPSQVAWRLTALAFADVAEFSRLMADDDVGTVQIWNRMQTEILLPAIDRYRGHLLDKPGDAFLVEFSSAVHALNWAIDVQRSISSSDITDRQGNPVRLRIGINVDDAIDDEGVLHSSGVNIAARIHQAAEPGAIVLTSIVRELVGNRVPANFTDLGTPALKNINIPVRVYSVDIDGRPNQAEKIRPYLQWHSRPTLAVLPFRTIGGGTDDHYFGEGITEAIITGVSRSRALFVVSRSSTLRYSNAEHDPKVVAEALGVKYLLSGSVRQVPGRLRIHAELVEVEHGHTIWAQQYDGGAEDVFAFEDQIVSNIVVALEPHVRAAEMARISNRPTDSLDAHDCVLRAITRLYQFSRQSYAECRELLERAVKLDPEYAQAQAYLAWCINFWIGEGHSRDLETDRTIALAAARRATELDAEDAFALAIHGHLTGFLEGNPVAGEELLEQAVGLDENASLAWALSAAAHAYLGQGDETRDRLRNVWRLSPYDQLNFFYWVIAGIGEFVASRYEEALVWLRRSNRANPRMVASLRMLAATLSLTGDENAAQVVGKQLLEIEPGFRVKQFVASYPLQRLEDKEKLERGLLAAGLPE